MLFSSSVFLFLFLPLLLLGCLILRRSLRLWLLLFASLFFYAWGEPRYVAVMLIVCGVSYAGALVVSCSPSLWGKRMALAGSLAIDLCILGYFKYFDFLLQNVNALMHTTFALRHIALPIGISFFTFQAISYVVDVYRGTAEPQKNLARLVLYISFFPQLIAGPIVKYHDIEKDLANNQIHFDDVVYGMERFIIGLAKKILLANPLGEMADPIFQAGYNSADFTIAWLGAIAYSLQLYFDFSGYSDMAIGLGRMFGFHFLENFNYPYISKSITEFWRRWHISLGSWFKEYVYIPLGGNRKGCYRTYLNLGIVFLLTGIWHGANWTFILWGIWHGLFIIMERFLGLGKDDGNGRLLWLRHGYTILAFVIGWTMFRAETVQEGIGFIETMFLFRIPPSMPFTLDYYLSMKSVLVLALAVIFSTPWAMQSGQWFMKKRNRLGMVCKYGGLVCLFLLSAAYLAASTYNPFIYFRF